MTKEEEHKLFLYGGIGGGLLLVVFLFHPGAPQVATHGGHGATPAKPQTQPNPNQSQLDEALIAARENALQMYDTTVLGEKTNEEQLLATQNEDLTQKQIAFNTNATQLKETGLATNAETTIAQEQTALEQSALNAEQSQQSNSWWQNILGGLFSGIGGIFSRGGLLSLFRGSSQPSQPAPSQPPMFF